jgi:DHA1 family tetracycline resistance protein-like MFS transporter
MKTKKEALHALLPLLLVIFIDTIGYFVVIPVIVRLFLHNEAHLLPTHTSMTTRAWLYSLTLMLSPLAFIICSPIIGHFSDRYGRKKALTGALIAACAGFLLPIIGIYQRSISLILIGRFIAGASSSSQPVAQAGVTDISQGKERAFYLGLIGFCMTLGMVIGPLSGSYLSDSHLVSWFNVTTPYWFALGLSVLNVLLLALYYRDLPTRTQQINITPKGKLLCLFIKKQVGLILLIFFCMELAWSQYYQAAFIVLSQHFKFSTNHISVFSSAVGLSMCIGLTFIYKLFIKHYSIEHTAKISLYIILIGLLICILPAIQIRWLASLLISLAVGIAYPALLSLISNRTEQRYQGYMLGCASTTLGIAWMITGLTAGPFTQLHWTLPWLATTFFILTGAILSYWIKRH